MTGRSIYDEIGGEAAVERIVDDFYDRVLDDESIAHYFDDQDMTALRAHQVQFVSSVTGGPVEYSGADMRSAHEHLDLDESDFAAVAERVEAALRANDVADEHVEGILVAVADLKTPVLGR